MGIRRAIEDDIDSTLELALARREQYQSYSPIFWRPAVGAVNAQLNYFRRLLSESDWICLVHEKDGDVDGFIMAQLAEPPPVYNPGGKICVIDDFMVAGPSLWRTVGTELLKHAEGLAGEDGALVSVTVCGERDEEKKRALLESGSHIASEWHVRAIGKHPV